MTIVKNPERLLAEVTHVTIHQEEWKQSLWAEVLGFEPASCGSSACLAGNTVIRDGHQLQWYVSDFQYKDQAKNEDDPSAALHEVVEVNGYPERRITGGDVRSLGDLLIPESITPVWGANSTTEGKAIPVVASQILGFDPDEDGDEPEEAMSLFEGDNTLEDLWDMAIEYTEGSERPITEEDRDHAFDLRAGYVAAGFKLQEEVSK